MDITAVSISMADYVKPVKPISTNKHRKTMGGDARNEIEKKQTEPLWELCHCLAMNVCPKSHPPAAFCKLVSAAPLWLTCLRPTVA